ncbi:MAG: response regulator [Chloroflexi bacterium]|uniref:Response regulator n=1 Tax=Candidatus Chlorohelix allophototropha TaxID=3003348 RepID=A0A8T7M8F7_9CHLR|nr:response regulator [Chloroflexota bacterium]WJW68354.1 response regulator [Chloroflexota bacterium L227-S17]
MVVLVINESDVFRKSLSRFLELRGYSVVEAATCEEGYLQSIKYKPQLVAVDNLIDSISCLNVCKTMQSIPGMETTGFVVFTDYDDEFETAASINLKATITKPNILPKMKEHFPDLK